VTQRECRNTQESAVDQHEALIKLLDESDAYQCSGDLVDYFYVGRDGSIIQTSDLRGIEFRHLIDVSREIGDALSLSA